MKIIVSGQHLQNFPEMQIYARRKIVKLSKLFPKILEADIRLIARLAHRGQEQDYSCHIKLVIPGNNLEIIDTERAIDKAIDSAVERAKRLLTRTKEKQISKLHKFGILRKIKERF